jgi:hypothetical protein
MKTKADIIMTFRETHQIRIPAGTEAKWIKGGAGGWAVEPKAVKLLSATHSLFDHDSTYYYIWVDAKDLTA